MASYTYYVFNLFVFIPVLLIDVLKKVGVWRQWKQLGLAYLIVSLPFVLWDVWAAQSGHWLFSERYITSFRLAHLPIEEILFFVTVPYAMMFVWEVIKIHVVQRTVLRAKLIKNVLILLAGACVIFAVVYVERAYTRSAFLVAGLTCIAVALWTKLYADLRFWYFQAALMVAFLLSNTFLTALPVILYSSSAIIGFRVGTIPLEDFFFNFSLITLFMMVYEKFGSKTTN